MDASTQTHNSSLNKFTQTLGKSGLQNIMIGQIQKIVKKITIGSYGYMILQ